MKTIFLFVKNLFFIFFILFLCSSCSEEELLTIQQAQNYVIAHRGSYQLHGLPENSRASLQEALSFQILGTEFDVRQTKDGELVICHDETFNGKEIAKSDFKELLAFTLSNGETIPTLKDFFSVFKEMHSSKILYAEMKYCDVNKVVDLVNEFNIQDNVTYISFNKSYCDRIVNLGLGAYVFYLSGDLSPQEALEEGYGGISYHESVFNAHPEWLIEAKELGLKVCVWPINDLEKMKYYTNKDILISTDVPTLYGN